MSKTKRIQLEKALPGSKVDLLAGTFLDPSHYDHLVSGEDVDVIKPSGHPLAIFRSNVLSRKICLAARPALRKAPAASQNRGMAAGGVKEDELYLLGNRFVKQGAVKGGTDKRYRPVKADGTVSNTSYARPVESGIIGYFDRYPRIPYCRQTAFNINHPELFEAARPYIETIDAVFKREAPERYAAQLKVVQETSSDFFISGTAFTTITVNRNWQTAVHKDQGDYRRGFGVMAVLEGPKKKGHYEGCFLCFPKYRVAVDMRMGDVLLADVHEWHGNTPLVGHGEYERISCVFYYREGMRECGSATEEMERANKDALRRLGVDTGDPSVDGFSAQL